MAEFNLIWDLDDAENFRSEIHGKPLYDMKCNQCFTFIEAQERPEDVEAKFCSNCGNPIK